MLDESKRRYLTKSRFKLALECPTKLFYTGKADVYPDQLQQDDFLRALAEGGFQVGELAKLMFPGGHEVRSSGHEAQIDETSHWLHNDEVTLFEAAICHGDLFARVDVLRKVGPTIDLIEVKAKSFDSRKNKPLRGARGGIEPGMRSYLMDAAFQRHVLLLAHPGFSVRSFLMLVDKSAICSVDRLNQRFRIRREAGRHVVEVEKGTNISTIGDPLLACIPVDDLIDELLAEPIVAPGITGGLEELVRKWAESYRTDVKIPPAIGAHCGKCEFRSPEEAVGQRSGLAECWEEAANFNAEDLACGSVLDLWNFRGKQELIDDRVLDLASVPEALFEAGISEKGLTHSQRQRIQVTKQWPGGGDFYLDAALLRREMSAWIMPLHFIDFETARVAIPFFSGESPYANVAFQFSHHMIHADDRLEHRTQFLSTSPGRKPNYDFVRALGAALGDRGTVLMWSPHENTTLKAIREELEADPAPPQDAASLLAFINDLITRKKDGRPGTRAMVDLCKLSERAYFHPATNGSSSIKKVLPTVMASSDLLKARYSQPIYGALNGIPSLNFSDWRWWQEVNGKVMNPYKLLQPFFNNLPPDTLGQIDPNDEIAISEGGAATMAFARLQFEDVTPAERDRIEAELKRYCELDTLAMAMVLEAWRSWI